jgi:hypothetical protein
MNVPVKIENCLSGITVVIHSSSGARGSVVG